MRLSTLKTPRFMKHVLTLLACVTLGTAAYSQSDKLGSLTSNINIEGLETQYNPETGVATAIGEVHIVYQGVEITSGRADYNSNTGEVIAKENVTIVKDGSIFRGENVLYNVNTKELKANNLRGGMSPLFYDAANIKSTEGEIKRVDGDQTYFTTHDSETPNYHMKARSMTLYPNDRIILRDVKVYVGDQAVLWFPYYIQPLDDELGYFFKPGFASQWGAFLLNQYGVLYGDHTLAKYMLDLRSERGIAGGVSLKSLRFKDNDQFGNILFYYAQDTSPLKGIGHEHRDASSVKEGRYRFDIQHRIYLPGPKESTWYLDFDITKLSDEFMLEDYYLNEFRGNPQPDNNIKLVKRSDDFTATLWGRFQVNKFFHTDSRLPELAFDFTRQPLFGTNFYYQGSTSLGLYRDKLSDGEQATLLDKIKTQSDAYKSLVNGSGTLIGPDGKPTQITALAGTTLVANNLSIIRTAVPKILLTQDDVSRDLEALKAEAAENKFFRFNSYHELLYPMSFGNSNWLNIVPRIGGGASYYSGISGGQTKLSSDTQPIFHLGLDISGRFSKEFTDVQNRTWGLDGLRHVVEPYINYSYLNADAIDGLPGIDRLTPSTRPRPIDVPLYTATDSLNTWNVARIGVRNVLQTKRDNVTYNWMGMNTFVDYFFKDPEFNRTVSNIYNDFYLNPLPWLGFTVDAQLPLGSSDFNFTEVNTGINWMPSKNFQWNISHQYLSHHPLFVNSSLIYSRIYARVNDNWGFSMNHLYEISDHTLEYQSYSIHRDLTSWSAELGALFRNNRGVNETGVLFTLTLKDFPSISVPLDLDPNPTGYGGRL